MSDEVKYEDKIHEAAGQKRDVDIVYTPTFGALKKAFGLIFEMAGFDGSDFKRLSDFQYYQGGYPSPSSPPKESNLAYQVAQVIKLEKSIGKDNFVKFLAQYGVTVTDVSEVEDAYAIASDDANKLLKFWQGAGIDSSIPNKRSEALSILLDKAQGVQKEICDVNDFIKTLAEEVEDKFGFKQSNFMKAVNLAVIRLKKGDGVMSEKLDDVVESAENLIEAVQPLLIGK